MMRTLVLLFSLVLVGCQQADESASESTPYKAIVDSKQMMNWLLDRNADVIWGSAGAIITVEGTQDLAPTTEEGWNAVRDAAATIAELSNVLMMPGHARAGADWTEFAQGLQSTAVQLIDAGIRKDADAVFDLGGQLYNVCTACHQLYMLPNP